MLAHVSSSVDQSGDLRMVMDGFIPVAVRTPNGYT
jgi:hypothetical protein